MYVIQPNISKNIISTCNQYDREMLPCLICMKFSKSSMYFTSAAGLSLTSHVSSSACQWLQLWTAQLLRDTFGLGLLMMSSDLLSSPGRAVEPPAAWVVSCIDSHCTHCRALCLGALPISFGSPLLHRDFLSGPQLARYTEKLWSAEVRNANFFLGGIFKGLKGHFFSGLQRSPQMDAPFAVGLPPHGLSPWMSRLESPGEPYVWDVPAPYRHSDLFDGAGARW